MRVTRIIDRVVRDTERARNLVVPVVLTAATIVAVAITSVASAHADRVQSGPAPSATRTALDK